VTRSGLFIGVFVQETVLLFTMWESRPVLSQLPMGTVLPTGHTSEQIRR